MKGLFSFKRIFNTTRWRIIEWRIVSVMLLRKISNYAGYFAVTIVGLIFSGVLYCLAAQRIISDFKNLDTIFIAIGGMIGTMLALVFSLSIIPIQRAVETFTPSIVKLYREDRIAQIIFVAVSAICLLSFIFAIDGVNKLIGPLLLFTEILIITTTLDLLRWYHRHISQLLQPKEAIRLLLLKIKGYISKIQQNASLWARAQWNVLPLEKKAEISIESLESAFYTAFSNHYVPVNGWTTELAEMALRGVSAGETLTVKIAISAMVEVACYCLQIRKDNIILVPTSIMLETVSDLDKQILIPIYDHFKDINRNAVALKAETTCVHIVQALGEIASCTAKLKGRAFPENSAPITFMPLGYLKECVEMAQRNGLDDAALQGSDVLLKVAQSIPDNISIDYVYAPVIDGWYEIARKFLISGKAILANEVSGKMMSLAHYVLTKNHFQFIETIEYMLDKLELLVPLAILCEKNSGSRIYSSVFAYPYDLAKPTSLGYLVDRATSCCVSQDEDRNWINPYNEFIKLNEIIYRHFRNIAEKVDLGLSSLLSFFTKTIEHIIIIYMNLLQRPVTENDGHLKEVSRQVPWYLAFFWVAFSKASTLNVHDVMEACDVLSWTGLSFYDIGYKDIAENSANNIASIVSSYCKICNNPEPYNIADLLLYIWYIHVLAEAKDDQAFCVFLENKMAKPQELTDEQWKLVQEVLNNRKEKLRKELCSVYVYPLYEKKARGLLRMLLQKNRQKNC